MHTTAPENNDEARLLIVLYLKILTTQERHSHVRRNLLITLQVRFKSEASYELRVKSGDPTRNSIAGERRCREASILSCDKSYVFRSLHFLQIK
jgi:hypothetical protein